MAEDFPAAHSMDTDWFAVDADGHIALFQSGEDAAVPNFVALEDEGYTLLERILAEAPQLIWDHAQVDGRHHQFQRDEHRCWDLMLFLDADHQTTELLRGIKLRWEPIAFQHADSRRFLVVQPTEIDDRAFDRLHEVGACAGCLDWTNFGAPPDLGFYRYEAQDYGNPPYTRTQTPTHPIRLADLPASMHDAAKARVFPHVRYHDAPVVQPAEHTPCQYYTQDSTATYMASDGVTEVTVEFSQVSFASPPLEQVSRPMAKHTAVKRWWQFWK